MMMAGHRIARFLRRSRAGTKRFSSLQVLDKNAAIMFTGQGSQFPGMGKDLYERHSIAKDIIDEADDVLGFKLSEIMFDKSVTSPLVLTANAQPAILVYSIILLELLKSEWGVDNLKDAGYSLALGHSLGEYSALVATEAIELGDAIKLVHQRGKLMQAAVDSDEYGMFALLRSPYKDVLELCESVNKCSDQKCDIANHNTDDQVVISGHMDAVENVIAQGKQSKAIRRAVRLDVSAPFHSRYMEPAVSGLEEALEGITFKDPIIPIVSNVSAQAYHTCADLKLNLTQQLYSTVQWYESLNLCVNSFDINVFHEVGPKRTLATFVNRHIGSSGDVQVQSFCTTEDVGSFVNELKLQKQDLSLPEQQLENQHLAMISEYDHDEHPWFLDEIRQINPTAIFLDNHVVEFKSAIAMRRAVTKFNSRMASKGISVSMIPCHTAIKPSIDANSIRGEVE